MRDVPGSNPSKTTFFSFSMQKQKGEDNLKLVPNLSYSNNLVKIRVSLGVFRHAESKSSLYFVLSLFLRRYWPFLVGTLDSCSKFLKHVKFLVEAVQFRRITPFSQTIVNTIDFRFCCKKNPKRINIGFGTKIEIFNCFETIY